MIAMPPEIGTGRVTWPGLSSSTWLRKAGGSPAAGSGSSVPPSGAVSLRLYSRASAAKLAPPTSRRWMLVGERDRLRLAALGEGQRDLGEGHHLLRRVAAHLERGVEVGLGRHGAGAEAGDDDLAPEQPGFDEVVHRLPVDPAGLEHAHHVLGGEAAVGGELLDPGVDRAFGQLDLELLGRLQLDAVLGQLLDRELAQVAGGAERVEEHHALLDVVVR